MSNEEERAHNQPRRPKRPTKAEIAAAEGVAIPDLIKPRLKVLFYGINPGLYSGVTGNHFARPGNRFWPALAAGGLTDRVLQPYEGQALLEQGYGITNLVERATARAADLSHEEFVEGRQRLGQKVEKYRPAFVAILGIGAFRKGFGRRKVALRQQPERFHGARLWVLPNPSGLNAHYTPDDFARLFGQLNEAVEELGH